MCNFFYIISNEDEIQLSPEKIEILNEITNKKSCCGTKIGCEAIKVEIFDVNSEKNYLMFKIIFGNFMTLLLKTKSFRRTSGLITENVPLSNRFPNPPATNE